MRYLLDRLMQWIKHTPELRHGNKERRDRTKRWLHDEEQAQLAEVKQRLDQVEKELQRRTEERRQRES